MITVLTPTGARPEAFAECVRMMKEQTCTGPVRWVIVDDGPEAMTTPHVDGWEVVHVRPTPLWAPGGNTQHRNILVGLEYCTDRIVVVEDDDAYADWWVERCDEWLQDHDLVGESFALYVHRGNGRRKAMHNVNHASLCSTALKGSAIDALRDACESGDKFIDMVLWRTFTGSKKLYRPEPRGVTGVKGWPGRPGIGAGHRL